MPELWKQLGDLEALMPTPAPTLVQLSAVAWVSEVQNLPGF